jgi:hypothetical protein
MKPRVLKLASCLSLLAFFFASGPAMADDAALFNMVKDMQEKMAEMQKTINQQNQKISQLERREPQIVSAPSATGEAAGAAPMSDYEFNERLAAATGGANKWLKDLSFKGDLRLRYEAFNYDLDSAAETDDRNRFRYRLRFGWEKKFSEDMKVAFSLASGENTGTNGLNIDPTSTNTTFDNNFNFKVINVEKAYASYSPSFLRGYGPLKKTTIIAGKHDNKFEKGSSDMIWDRDVKPEGVTETMDFKFLDTGDFDLNGWATFGQFILDEDAATRGDANLFAYQIGLNPTIYTPFFDRPLDLTQALSLYDYNNYARNSNFIIGTTGNLGRGNANFDNVATELDAGKFKVIESYSELAVYPGGLPVRFHVDLAGNPAAEVNHEHTLQGENEEFAYGFGIKLGGIVKKGDWETGYAYKHIGANAVVGAFNDSDFGDGHSGKAGHVFKGAYALTDTLSLGAAAIFVENLNAYSFGILGQKQRRFQVDLVWKF